MSSSFSDMNRGPPESPIQVSVLAGSNVQTYETRRLFVIYIYSIRVYILVYNTYYYIGLFVTMVFISRDVVYMKTNPKTKIL